MSSLFSVCSTPSTQLALSNYIFISLKDYIKFFDSNKPWIYVKLQNFLFVLQGNEKVKDGYVALNGQQRSFLRLALDSKVSLSQYSSNIPELSTLKLSVYLMGKQKGNFKHEIDVESLKKFLLERLNSVIYQNNQLFNISFPTENGNLILGFRAETDSSGKLSTATNISFVKEKLTDPIRFTSSKKISGETLMDELRSNSNSTVSRLEGIDFQRLGIGGLDKEFNQIFRRAFASRMYPPQVAEKLGTKHVKGLMLYGPPGCGKTLIARQITKVLTDPQTSKFEIREPVPPKIVSGPEILNKFVGGSEEKIRELFVDAERDEEQLGVESPLHVIIFDEIDAICKKRGNSRTAGSGVNDSVVNQLLAKIDGVESLRNILLIGMTNRLDMIDEALLRPGRFEVHIEIGLPTQHGREQILKIHTRKMKENDSLSPDVDLISLAKETKNYSGAEIEGLVKSAASFAYLRIINDAKKENSTAKLEVTKDDFNQGLTEIVPAFGFKDEENLALLFKFGISLYNDSIKNIVTTVNDLFTHLPNSKLALSSCLITGPVGSGKSALLASLASQSNYPLVKYIPAEKLLALSDQQKQSFLFEEFESAYRSELSLIVLDDLERLIEFVHVGPRFSNGVLQTIKVLVNRLPPKENRKIMILASCGEDFCVEELGLGDVFSTVLSLNPVNNKEELIILLSDLHTGDVEVNKVDIGDICEENEVFPIGVKTVVNVFEMSKERLKKSGLKIVNGTIFLEALKSLGK
eukprot:maker-scaffold_54-snap-gene-1.27-mRNA-1 protein AED:0.01 eAED:0.01 QI:51/1/0.75/1/0.66/0.5/4/0/749